MFFVWLRLRAAWLFWAALTLSTHALGQETVDWTQEVVLHDGRPLTVRLQGNSVPQPFYLAHQKSQLSQFQLAFEHPQTRQTITWQGARYFDPLLLDIVDGTAYLVVYGRPTQATAAQYGCPELPYVYLRHSASGWQPIPVEQAPSVLVQANLSVHGLAADSAGRHLTPPEVASRLERQARESLGLVQIKIPRTLADWNTSEKRSALTDRVVGDCRAPRPPLPALVLPPAVAGNASVMESSDYVPEKAFDADDWNALMTDPQRAAQCGPLFQRVELESYHLDLHFTHDKAARKRVPYARNGVLDPDIQVLCGERVWFIQNRQDANPITITQYTRTGDLVFRASFVRPHDEAGLIGSMRLPSLRAEGDYLYFDWMLWRPQGSQHLLKRSLTVRVPVSPLAR